MKSRLPQLDKNETESLKNEEKDKISDSLDFKASYISFQTKNSTDMIEKKIEENNGKFKNINYSYFVIFTNWSLVQELPLKIRPSFGSKTK